ncbi:MAG: hypothetical protein EBT86_11365 [Actinobacteria bacterium]|nr:hypothetical protein [Actinomycetota bacterium]NBY43225.1 hypothetical protein [Micrococcales bacterium]
MNNCFVLPEETDVVDLTKYLERAQKLDNSGAVRFRAYGDVLTVYVAPIATAEFDEHAPMVLGLRTMALAESAEFDVTVLISEAIQKLQSGETVEDFSLVKRLSKVTTKANQVCLPNNLVDVSWNKETPTRTGWEMGGEFYQETLTEAARKGVAEITETLPTSVGGPIAARVRAEIWGKAIDYKYPVPMGAAFVSAGLGFLVEGEVVPWYVSGDWVRLSSLNGHVLAKFAYDYVSMNS